MASANVKTCQKLAGKAKSLAQTLSESMDGHADLMSLHQCMDALHAAQGELECAFDAIMDITDEAHG